MAATPPEYKRSFEDELDWNPLEQLDRVVLQISGFSFRTKQLCLAIDIAVVGLLIKFTDNELDQSIFVAGFVIPISFWVLDSISYYYQVKPRGVMDNIRDRLRERNSEQIIHGAQLNVIDRSRSERNSFLRVLGAFFNHSMWLYLFVGVSRSNSLVYVQQGLHRMSNKARVFISYTKRDGAVTNRLLQRLNDNLNEISSPFIDALRPQSHRFQQFAVIKALLCSHFLIVVESPSVYSSPWVRLELLLAKLRLLPVLRISVEKIREPLNEA